MEIIDIMMSINGIFDFFFSYNMFFFVNILILWYNVIILIKEVKLNEVNGKNEILLWFKNVLLF